MKKTVIILFLFICFSTLFSSLLAYSSDNTLKELNGTWVVDAETFGIYQPKMEAMQAMSATMVFEFGTITMTISMESDSQIMTTDFRIIEKNSNQLIIEANGEMTIIEFKNNKLYATNKNDASNRMVLKRK